MQATGASPSVLSALRTLPVLTDRPRGV